MADYLDLENWARRELFEFFRDYTNPYFNVCTRLDVTRLLEFLREHPGAGVSVAYHYFALRVANEIEPFRYRLKEGKVFVYDVINGGTTVLMPNEAFTFAYFAYHEDFDTFGNGMSQAVNEVKTGSGALKPTMRDDTLYFTTLPWFAFTSFAHARNRGRGDSIPRIAFGKFFKEHERMYLPISVEVHHALMDGVHVGRYLDRLQEVLTEPKAFIESGRKLAAP